MDPGKFTDWALQLHSVTEQPHFHKKSFRINKRIFATLDGEQQHAVLKLPEIAQSVYCSCNSNFIYPATGRWGRQGWTVFELAFLPEELVLDALTTAYNTVGKK